MRRDDIVEYTACLRIRQHTLKTSSYYDPQAPQARGIAGRDQYEGAMIDALPTWLPAFDDADAELHDGFRRSRCNSQYANVILRHALVRSQHFLQPGGFIGLEQPGLVGDGPD
jgi:hypothetical protein